MADTFNERLRAVRKAKEREDALKNRLTSIREEMGVPAPRAPLERTRGALGTLLGPLAAEVLGEEAQQRFAEQYPASAVTLGLGGGVARYGGAFMLGGPAATTALGAAEAVASKPEESMSALLAKGAGVAGMERTQQLLERSAQSPIGRAFVDVGFGKAVDYGIKGYRGLRGLTRKAPASAAEAVAQEAPTIAPRATDEQSLTESLAAVRAARGEPLATEIPQRRLPAPSGYVMPEPLPKALPAGTFPPESPRFRTRTVAEERVALAEQQLRDAKNLDEAIAARQAAWEAEQARKVKALYEEPSRFPGAANFRPPAPPVKPRELRAALEERASQLAQMGQKRQADELTARVKFLDEMRQPWDELTPEQQRQFETFMTYYESRKAQGLVPAAEGATRKQFVKAQNRALRQLAAMEGWYKLPEAQRAQFLEGMQNASMARRMEGMENEWQKAVNEFRMTPLDQIVIINPATGREVTIASALKRPQSHPARFEAEAFMDELYTATRELTEGTVTGRARTPFVPSRIGERPTPAAAAELPPVPMSEAERRAARAAGESERRRIERQMGGLRNRLGAADPALITAVARTFGGAVLGGAGGASMGETPGERLALGLGGALVGAGVAAGLPEAAGAKLNEALEDIVNVSNRKGMRAPGGRPFEATPEGLTEVGVAGVKRGMPIPKAVTAARVAAPLTPTAEAIVQEDRNLLRRMGLAPELQERLAPRIAAARADMTETRPWQDDMKEAARLMNIQRENLANIPPKGMTGAQGLAIASLIRENTETIGKRLADIDALSPLDDAGRLALEQEIADLDLQNASLLPTLMAGRSEQGRALNANKALASLTSNPTYWLIRGQRVKGATSLTQDERIKIANLLNKGEAGRGELMQFLASLRKTSKLGQTAQIFRAGLLTGLAGRMRDVLSTGNTVLVQPILRTPGAAVDAIASRYVASSLGGPATQYRAATVPRIEEWRAMGRGAWEGMQDAAKMLGLQFVARGGKQILRGNVGGARQEFRDFGEFVRAANLDEELMKRLDVPKQINIDMFPGQKANALVDFYQKYMMRVSGAADRIFRGMAFRGAMDEGARLQAIREGLSGDALEQRVKQILATPSDDLVADAVLQSEINTFVNEGGLASGLSATKGILASKARERAEVAGSLVEGGLNILAPFTRTPANVATRIAEATPFLGTGLTIVRAATLRQAVKNAAIAALESKQTPEMLRTVRQKQRRFVEAMMAQGAGVGALAVGFHLYDQGVLTGDMPNTENGREQWALEGKRPNSILINGEWYPIGNLGPYGTLISMAASMRQDAERTGVERSVFSPRTMFRAARATLNQPFVTGPQQVLEASLGGEREQDRYLKSQAGAIVPTGIAQIARAGDFVREPQTPLQAVLSRIPGMQSEAPVRLNIFGEPMRSTSNVGFAFKDLRRADRTVAEMARVGAEVAPIPKWRDEPFKQYQLRQRTAGQRTRQMLNELFMSPDYLSSSDVDKREMITNTVKQARDYATEYLKAQGIRQPEKRR